MFEVEPGILGYVVRNDRWLRSLLSAGVELRVWGSECECGVCRVSVGRSVCLRVRVRDGLWEMEKCKRRLRKTYQRSSDCECLVPNPGHHRFPTNTCHGINLSHLPSSICLYARLLSYATSQGSIVHGSFRGERAVKRAVSRVYRGFTFISEN